MALSVEGGQGWGVALDFDEAVFVFIMLLSAPAKPDCQISLRKGMGAINHLPLCRSGPCSSRTSPVATSSGQSGEVALMTLLGIFRDRSFMINCLNRHLWCTP
jgi:hypothetical protein